MEREKTLKTALWLAVGLKISFALYTGGVFANEGEQGKFEGSIEADVGGSLAYDYDPISVEAFAKWANLSLAEAKEKAAYKPYLLQREALESVNGFNPYNCAQCDVKTLGELEDGRFSDEQAWKWFRFRSEEIGACFEDELFDAEINRCVLIEELNQQGEGK